MLLLRDKGLFRKFSRDAVHKAKELLRALGSRHVNISPLRKLKYRLVCEIHLHYLPPSVYEKKLIPYRRCGLQILRVRMEFKEFRIDSTIIF